MPKSNRSSSKAFIFIVLVFLISRVFIYTVSYLGDNLFCKYNQVPTYNTIPGTQTRVISLPYNVSGTHLTSLKDFIKFDSDFYLQIAENGYDNYKMSEKHPAANFPFFPLYPLLISFIHTIAPLGYSLIGYILSNVFAILGLYFLYQIVMELTSESEIAKRAVIYMLLYPASIYLSLIYTESLFIFLSTMTVYFLLKKKIGLSILFASISSITRIPGIANLLLIAFYLFRESGFNIRKIKLKYWGWLILSGMPLLSFFTYMWAHTGDFFAVFHELENWGRTAKTPFVAYLNYFKEITFFTGWDLAIASFIFTTMALVIYIYYFAKGSEIHKKLRPELALYGLVLILIPLSSATGTMTSMVRYYMASFPLFIAAAHIGYKSHIADFFFTLLFLSFNVIYTIGYINGFYFVV